MESLASRNIDLSRLLELESDIPSMHHFYFTGRSISALEVYGDELLREIEKGPGKEYKGIVKHFSLIMPYFDNDTGAKKILCDLRESVSIARDCYDEYTGNILIECDPEWNEHVLNRSVSKVLEYMKSLDKVRYIILAPYTRNKNLGLFQALAAIGVWAFVEVKDIDIKSEIGKLMNIIREAGFDMSDCLQEELCSHLEKRQTQSSKVEEAIIQWLRQVSLNRKMEGDDSKEITKGDISLISGVPDRLEKHTIGFGLSRGGGNLD